MKSIISIITMTLNINHDYEKSDDALLVYDVLGSKVCLYEKDYSETLTNTCEHKLKVLQLNKNISIN